jgi:methionyl-tRNA formyltransferase
LVTLTPEKMAGVSGAVNFEPLAEEFGIPLYRTSNVNDRSCEAWLRQLEPDVLLVIGWTQLLKEPLLQLPKLVTIGFHASLLPRYRGRAPVNWAIIHGETETGNTMIVLEPGADEGDIIAQRRIPIAPNDTCGTIYDQVGRTEADMLAEVLPLIRQDRMPRRKQDNSIATVMPRRRPADGIIDWGKPAHRLHDWVRALTHPYPGAFTFVPEGESPLMLTIWAAEAVPEAGSNLEPGFVEKDAQGYPLVAAGSGALRLLSIQFAGHEEVPANQVWRPEFAPGVILTSNTPKVDE